MNEKRLILRPPLRRVLISLGACAPALTFAKGYGGAWSTALIACDRHDWLLWLYERLLLRGLVPVQPLVRLACMVARSLLEQVSTHYMAEGWAAVEAAEGWCRGAVTDSDVSRAFDDAELAAGAWAWRSIQSGSVGSSVAFGGGFANILHGVAIDAMVAMDAAVAASEIVFYAGHNDDAADAVRCAGKACEVLVLRDERALCSLLRRELLALLLDGLERYEAHQQEVEDVRVSD